jgi:hypothetical protein
MLKKISLLSLLFILGCQERPVEKFEPLERIGNEVIVPIDTKDEVVVNDIVPTNNNICLKEIKNPIIEQEENDNNIVRKPIDTAIHEVRNGTDWRWVSPTERDRLVKDEGFTYVECANGWYLVKKRIESNPEHTQAVPVRQPTNNRRGLLRRFR